MSKKEARIREENTKFEYLIGEIKHRIGPYTDKLIKKVIEWLKKLIYNKPKKKSKTSTAARSQRWGAWHDHYFFNK